MPAAREAARREGRVSCVAWASGRGRGARLVAVRHRKLLELLEQLDELLARHRRHLRRRGTRHQMSDSQWAVALTKSSRFWQIGSAAHRDRACAWERIRSACPGVRRRGSAHLLGALLEPAHQLARELGVHLAITAAHAADLPPTVMAEAG